jgi:hypothetical protein
MTQKSNIVPEAVLQLQRQLEQFRSTQSRRAKLPESLWQSAVELARQYGVYSVASPLRLDYIRLKKRLGGGAIARQNGAKPAFVELTESEVTPRDECTIEFEAPSGNKMRVQCKASVPPDWVSLLRAWRETEG